MIKTRALALALAAGAAACSRPSPQPNLSVMVHIPQPRFYCNDTAVTPLGDAKDGGYRFDCAETGHSMQIAYGPHGDAKQITSITMDLGTPRDILLPSARDELAKRGLPPCEYVEGIDPATHVTPTLPMDGEHLAYGSTKFLLAYPCGDVVLQLGEPLPR